MKWNVGKILSKWQLWMPEKTAIIYEDRPISYQALNQETNRVAHLFKEMGLQRQDRVAVDLMNCPEFLACYFAAAKLGLIFVPLNFRLVARELEYQINRCDCRLLVFHHRFATEIEAVKENLSVPEEAFICVKENGMNGMSPATPDWATDYHTALQAFEPTEPVMETPVDLDDPFLILYTSGVTGNPKGAVITHGQTYFKCFQIINYTDMRRDDVFQSQVPLCHSAGLAGVTTPALCRGATLLMRTSFDPVKFGEDIETYKATIVFGLATMMRFVLDSGVLDRVDLSSVRFAFGGGEKTPRQFYDTLEKKGLRLLPGFGQTENSAMVLMPPNAPEDKKNAAGVPNFFTEIEIRDETGRPVSPGTIGEITAVGPNVMKEYWDMPDATRATLSNGVLNTGDLGYMDEDGYVYIVDRMKNMYRSGAENVYPAEVEAVLMDHPKIDRIAIVGVPDEKWGETGKAFIVSTDGQEITQKEVVSFLEGKVARYKFPKYVQCIESMPTTASGKVRKAELVRQPG